MMDLTLGDWCKVL